MSDKAKRVKDFREKKEIVKSAKEKYRLIEDFTYKDTPKTREEKYLHGLSSLDQRMNESKANPENLKEAYIAFNFLKRQLDDEDILPEKKTEKYKESLARRGYRLVNATSKKEKYHIEDKELIKYYDKHLSNKSSGLERAIAVVSSLSIILGIAIGYPALTGNTIANTINGSVGYGAALLVFGLLGAFLSTRK